MASGVSANRKGKSNLVGDAKAWSSKKENLHDTFQSGVNITGRSVDATTGNARNQPLMPARYAPLPSNMDKRMAMRSKLLSGPRGGSASTNGYVEGVGVAQYDEKVDAWLMDKAALADKLRYDQTFARLFSQTDHATRDKFMKLVLFFFYIIIIYYYTNS